MSAGVKTSRPMLAQPLAFVEPGQLKRAVEAVITIHRDYGNRTNRKLARLKYVLAEWGIERFREEFASRFGEPFAPPREISWHSGCDHLGWHRQENGKYFLGIPTPSGRIRDGQVRWRTGLREAVERFQPGVRLTPQQNLILTDIPDGQRAEIEQLLRSHGIQLAQELPPIIREALSCVSLPTCGLAITEAERVLPEVLEELCAAMARTGIAGDSIATRITGCANGCARPYTAEIGIVGQSVNVYTIYLGASPLGTRLGTVFAAGVPRSEIAARLEPVFACYAANRQPGESFGDYCYRTLPK
jgi:sulfite reductase (ferredoxin)